MMCDLDIVIAISGWIHSELQPQHLQGPERAAQSLPASLCPWASASGASKSFATDEKPLALDMALCHGLVLRVSDHIAGFMQPDIICIQPGCDHFHIKVPLVSHFYSIHLTIHAELCDAGNLDPIG